MASVDVNLMSENIESGTAKEDGGAVIFQSGSLVGLLLLSFIL